VRGNAILVGPNGAHGDLACVSLSPKVLTMLSTFLQLLLVRHHPLSQAECLTNVKNEACSIPVLDIRLGDLTYLVGK
jgi:hypothetical protein